ncbi:MAG: DUF2017 domain-containing protein [Actinomycetes bacterium]
MATRFHRSRRGVVVTFHPDEAPILRNLISQLTDLVGEVGEGPREPDSPGEDPLAAMVGIGTSTAPPDDPALARLFPDAYPDDPERAGDFRRFTEQSLAARKADAAGIALATMESPGQRRTLSTQEAHAWLTVLTDLRLVLGTRLEVSEDWDEQYALLADDDPRRAGCEAYNWLSFLQESLVHALW